MARIWKEKYERDRHRNHMPFPPNTSSDPGLDPRWVICVDVCSFTFEFHSVAQIRACHAYFAARVHPSSRLPFNSQNYGDHWEAQRWFERLPMYLLEEPKRIRVRKALERALALYGRTQG